MRAFKAAKACKGTIALIFLAMLLAFRPGHAGSVLGDDFNQDESHDYNGMPKLRLNLETGYSQWMYNPDSLTSDHDRYLNTMESGWNIAADVAWFPWDKGGLGLTWIWFLSKSDAGNVKMDSAGPGHKMRERASFVYYGPTFLSRMQFGRFGLIVGSFSAGWLDIRDYWTDNGAVNDVKAGEVAVVANVGWEYAFYRLVSLGVNGRVLLCNVTKYTYNGVKINVNDDAGPDQWGNISMNRFELDFGIRFGL
ncbi:MAG: hypothetical protein JWP91_1197 [Fibrobacteres bacterium]|nr:hypothetical protein [Fibrobacterota bacterium]